MNKKICDDQNEGVNFICAFGFIDKILLYRLVQASLGFDVAIRISKGGLFCLSTR